MDQHATEAHILIIKINTASCSGHTFLLILSYSICDVTIIFSVRLHIVQ